MACPICQSETAPAYRPFCSQRCADIDLGRWMLGHYAIPAPLTGEDGDPPDHRPQNDP
ncbi:MAG: DNA gyrase inhibitor YacG [Pseudomonadota bacterium]